MPDTGEIRGKIVLEDEFSRVIAKLEARLTEVEKATTALGKRTKSEFDKIQAAYNKTAASLDPVVRNTQRYEAAEKSLNAARQRGIITQTQYNHQLGLAKTKYLDAAVGASRLSTALSSAGKQLLAQAGAYVGVSAAIGATVALIHQFTTANIEAEQSAAQVEAAVGRSFSGLTVTQINDIADALSHLSGIDDELIIDAEVLATKYNRIGADIFPRYAKAALDAGVATGDIAGKFQSYGKILNQPIKGLTLLGKEGVAVSKSQSDMVKALLRSNDLLGAQEVLLGILEQQYKGAAAAARDTLGGALQALGTSWENLLEKAGEDRLGPLREGVEKLIRLIDTLNSKFEGLVGAWNFLDVVAKQVLVTITRLQLGAAEGPLARLFNPEGAKQSAAKLRQYLKGLEADLAKSRKSLDESVLAYYGIVDPTAELERERLKSTTTTNELTDAEVRLAESIADARQKIVDHISSLRLQTIQAEELWVAAIQGLGAYQAKLLDQKVANEILKQENDLRKLGLSLTQEQIKAIDESIRKTDKLERATAALVKTLNGIDIKPIDLTIPNLSQTVQRIQLESFAREGATGRPEIDAEFEQDWNDFSDSVREWLKSQSEALDDYKQKVIAAHQLQTSGALTAQEMERELARIRIEQNKLVIENVLTQADAWAGVISTISNLFGGFGSKAISTIQTMISTWQSFNSLGNQVGGSAGSAISGAGAFFAVAGAIFDWQRQDIARTRQRQYTSSATRNMTGEWQEVGRQGRALADQLDRILQSVVDALESTVMALPDIEVRAREDGKAFQAYIRNVLIGTFASMEEAIDAAAMAAIQHLDLSRASNMLRDIVADAAESAFRSVDDLLEAMDFANRLSTQNLPQHAARMREELLQFTRDWEQATLLFRGNADALDEALTSIADRFVLSLTDVYNNLLGIKEDPKAKWERDKIAYNAQRAIMVAQITLLYEEIRARIAAYRAHQIYLRQFTNPAGDSGAGAGNAGDGGNASGPRLPGGGSRPHKGGWNPNAPQTDIRNPTNDAQLAALYTILDNLARALQGITPEITGSYPGGRGAGGSGGRAENPLDALIRDTRRAIAQSGMTEYQRALDEIIRKWDEATKGLDNNNNALDRAKRTRDAAIKAADGNADAIKRANDEYARVTRNIARSSDRMAEANRVREEEIALLNQQAIKDLVDRFREFAELTTPFDEIRENAAALIKDIEGSPLGDARKAAMIGRVLDSVERQLDRLSNERMSSVLGQMLGDLEKYGVNEQELASARQAMAVIEHELKVQNYTAEIEMLKLEGRLTADREKLLDDMLNRLRNIDPTKILEDAGVRFKGYEDAVDSVTDAVGNLAEASKDAATTLLDIFRDISDSNRELLTDDSLSALSPQAQRAESKRIYEETLAAARKGNVQALRDFTGVRQTYLDIERAYSHSGPDYAELFEKVLREGSGLILSPEVEQAAMTNLIAEQTATIEEGQAIIHNDLTTLRSSVVDGLNVLALRLGQPAVLNGIDRFAANGTAGAGSISTPTPLNQPSMITAVNDNATAAREVVDAVRSTGDSTVRNLVLVSHDVNVMRGSIDTLTDRLSVLDNKLSRLASGLGK